MKTHWLVYSVVALWPALALAQNSTPSPSIKMATPQPQAGPEMDPEARALLARAIQSYKGISGISYTTANTLTTQKGVKDAGTTLTQYSSPNKLNISYKEGSDSSGVVSDGANLYLIGDGDYYKVPTSAETVSAMLSSRDASGRFIAAMIKGHNPVTDIQNVYSGPSNPYFKNFRGGKVVYLGSRVVDGEILEGIQYTYSVSMVMKKNHAEPYSDQITAWFGGHPFLLRRVQSRTTTAPGKFSTRSEKIVDQQLSPTFAPDTFKFNSKGLKPASTKSNDTYWDPRLKVGTNPFAFSAKALDGKTISLANYKGKVVLMDFWATWCGPCVAGLPEIKGAYDKYHTKGLEIVGISLDENKSDLTSFIKARKMAWPQLFDGKAWKSSIPTSYGVKAIPFLLLVGKDGKIAAVNPRDNLDAAVKTALAK